MQVGTKKDTHFPNLGVLFTAAVKARPVTVTSSLSPLWRHIKNSKWPPTNSMANVITNPCEPLCVLTLGVWETIYHKIICF